MRNRLKSSNAGIETAPGPGPATLIRAWFVIVAVVLLAGCGPSTPSSQVENPVPVKLAPVERRELAIPILTSGTLYPETVVKLSFKLGGLIAKIHVDTGEKVKKGQLLASLDLAEIQARYSQAQKAWEKSRRDLRRVENLYKDRAATLEQRQDMQTAFDIAKANLEIADFNRKHAHIRAPSRGTILTKIAEVGEMIGPGMPAFVFGSNEGRWVIKAAIPEQDVVHIAPGDRAVVRFDAYREREFLGAVDNVAQAVDPAVGAFGVEINLDPDGTRGVTLMTGFVGKVAIEPATRENYHVIPIAALVEGEGNLAAVFTVKDGKAHKLTVKLAHFFTDTAAVASGLDGISKLVTSGAPYLRNGAPVKVVDDPRGE